MLHTLDSLLLLQLMKKYFYIVAFILLIEAAKMFIDVAKVVPLQSRTAAYFKKEFYEHFKLGILFS